ncbi:MAG TPA: hypothetical protein VF821_21070 [Lentzea sp.]
MTVVMEPSRFSVDEVIPPRGSISAAAEWAVNGANKDAVSAKVSTTE